MNANSAQKPGEPVRDEWGIFDPRRAGVPAVMEALRGNSTSDPGKASPPPAAPPRTDPAESAEALQPALRAQSSASAGALYTLEAPVQCPQCEQEIRTLRVLRVLRTQASFTSTLPRKGYVVVCPECERMLSAELSGLV